MNWARDDWKNVIFSYEPAFYILERKNQSKIWRLEKSYYQNACDKRSAGDGEEVEIWGGISDFGTVNAKINTKNMNGKLY